VRFVRFWFPVFLYSGIIFYVSSLPQVVTPPGIPWLDKVAHLFEYGIWAVLAARAIQATQQGVSIKIVWLAVLFLSLVHGMADEYLQSFIPGRDANLFDVLADCAGGALGGYVYLGGLLRKGREEKRPCR